MTDTKAEAVAYLIALEVAIVCWSEYTPEKTIAEFAASDVFTAVQTFFHANQDADFTRPEDARAKALEEAAAVADAAHTAGGMDWTPLAIARQIRALKDQPHDR
jgi:hypothetical protein